MNRKPETAALKALLARVDALKAEMDGEGPLSDEVKRRLNNKVRLELNYHSNRIEGNSLDYEETKLLLLKDLTANGKPLKDHLEIKGHNEALKKLEAIAGKEEKETFETFIRRAYEQEKLPVFQELGYRFHWEGLKNSGTQLSELAFSVRINLEHRFKYSVSVAFPEIPDLEKLYSQTISEEERRNLVRQVGNKLVEEVEKQLRKRKE